MKIDVLTLFPEMFDGFLSTSILKRSLAKEVVEINLVNIRDFTLDKYGRVDDYPIGGGAGLVMKAQPLVDSIKSVRRKDSKVILFSPKGRTLNQKLAEDLSKESHLVFVCGHYEGVDERISDYIDLELSIGDYVLTGGEVAAMVSIDAITRLLKGAISEESLMHETFNNNLLEYPQYTLPRVYENKKVPDILFSGNHKAIEKYRLKESLRLTMKYRPDLFAKIKLSKQEKELVEEIENNVDEPPWLTKAISKGSKFIK